MSLIKIDNPLFFRWAQYLVLSLPITIIFSRFLADLTIVILALFFLTFKKTNYFYKNKIIILATVFIIFCSISSILSNNPFVSLKSSFLHIRFILFILSLSLLFVYAPEDFLKKLFYIFLSCYLILFFDATFQFFFKFNIFGYVVSPINRVSSLFFDELVLGSYLVKLFPLIIFLYFYLNLKFKPIYLIYFIIHLYFTIFITGERVAFFTLNIYYMIFGLLLTSNIFLRFFSFASVILIFFSTVLFSENIGARTSFKKINDAFSNKNSTICNDTLNTISKKNKEFSGKFIPNCEPIFEIFNKKIFYLISVMHFNHYYTAFSIFKDNKILGTGAKSFREICKNERYFLNEFSCSTHPHNYYIQILSETGILGFISFSLIYLSILYLFFKSIFNANEKNRLCKIILLSMFLVNFLPFLPSGNLFNNWVSILYTFPLGFLLGLYQNNIK